jgi:hypothetical protein
MAHVECSRVAFDPALTMSQHAERVTPNHLEAAYQIQHGLHSIVLLAGVRLQAN